MYKSIPYKVLQTACIILACGILTGCARVGERFAVRPLPAGAPTVEEILRDLTENDAAIKTFRASGTFRIETPETGQRRFRGRIAYRRPTDLYIRGDHQFGARLFEMRCSGEDWIIDIPPEDQQFRSTGATLYADVPFSVSPLDVALEVFFQEDWGALNPKDVRMTMYDPEEQIAAIEMRRPQGLRRQVKVHGPPWTVISSTLKDWRRRTLAETRRSNYRVIDGIRFSTAVEAEFPVENARMFFQLPNPVLNQPIDETLFYIDPMDNE